jgi:short-subunit dehydrogenase
MTVREASVELQGKRVLVTGASSGIGAELALRMAAAGATVGICARREDRLQEVLARCQVHAPDSRAWVCDLTDFDEVDRLAVRAVDELGGVDVLVNNAGVPKRRLVTALDSETVDEVLEQMVAQGSGLIVNVSSVAATLSSPGEAAYDASKAALSVFFEAASIDLADTGVKVLIVYPGVVDTELFTIPGNDPLPPAIEKIEVSELVDGVMEGIASDALEVYVPSWFKEITTRKAANPQEFLAASAAWVREQAKGS